jgi:hypothetical protein
MGSMAKGQFILEFLILVSLAIIIGIMYLAITNQLLFSGSEEQRILALDDIGFRLQNEVIVAATVEDGYSRNITLPTLTNRFPYNISSDNTTITLTSGNVERIYEIPQINGRFQIGRNVLTKNGMVQVVSG